MFYLFKCIKDIHNLRVLALVWLVFLGQCFVMHSATAQNHKSHAASEPACHGQALVHLQHQEQTEINNDKVRINWGVQTQANSADAALKMVNRVLNEAIDTFKRNAAIENMRNNVQTYPNYGANQYITNWQGSGQLSFEIAVAALEAQGNFNLPKGLVLSGLDYFPSNNSVLEAKQKLLQQAMQQFQAKAQRVAQGFGYARYALSEVHIQDDNAQHAMPMMANRVFAAEAQKMVNVPTAPGNSMVSVGISGKVCLLKDK